MFRFGSSGFTNNFNKRNYRYMVAGYCQQYNYRNLYLYSKCRAVCNNYYTIHHS